MTMAMVPKSRSAGATMPRVAAIARGTSLLGALVVSKARAAQSPYSWTRGRHLIRKIKATSLGSTAETRTCCGGKR